MNEINSIDIVIIMALPRSYLHLCIVDLVHIADMDEPYGTYVDDEYFDNYDYDEDTDDATDHDTDDAHDNKKDNYTAAGAAPNAGAAPTQTRPSHTQKILYVQGP